jgi:hypothetical protein
MCFGEGVKMDLCAALHSIFSLPFVCGLTFVASAVLVDGGRTWQWEEYTAICAGCTPRLDEGGRGMCRHGGGLPRASDVKRCMDTEAEAEAEAATPLSRCIRWCIGAFAAWPAAGRVGRGTWLSRHGVASTCAGVGRAPLGLAQA